MNKSKEEGVTDTHDPMKTLEDALLLCKFGKFHYKLLTATLMAVIAATVASTTSGYVLPIAECDLNMSFVEKGLLSGISFFGQIFSLVFTGFVIDAFGRKMFLIIGNVGLFLTGFLEGSSQTYWMLLLAKFLEGICLSVSYNATSTMISEFVHMKVRDRILMTYSSFMPISMVLIALVSWALLPYQWDFRLGSFAVHSWNIYFYVCSIWSLIAALMYYYLPESPKFLLSHGRADEALDVIKRIYIENTGSDGNTFPITTLKTPGMYFPTKTLSMKKQFTSALFDMKELFRRPLFGRMSLFSLTTTWMLMLTAIRLWFPQLSTIIENYQHKHGGTDKFCTMIDEYTLSLHKNASINNGTAVCVPQLSGSETYINGLLLGVISLVCSGASGFLVSYTGQKPLMLVLFILSAACSIVLNWCSSSIQIGLLVASTCACIFTVVSLQHSILLRSFPTTIRSIALALVLMMGRIGSLVGNIIFPILLQQRCMVPFLSISVICIVIAGISCFLPNPRKDNRLTGDK